MQNAALRKTITALLFIGSLISLLVLFAGLGKRCDYSFSTFDKPVPAECTIIDSGTMSNVLIWTVVITLPVFVGVIFWKLSAPKDNQRHSDR